MPEPTPQGPCVLLVEDMQNHAQSLIRLLRREGYRVDTEMTAEGAVRAVKSTTYAAVLMDIELDLGESDEPDSPVISNNTPPELAGLEVIRYIRTVLGMSDLPIVVVSGLDHHAFWDDLERELRSDALHVAAIVVKPDGPKRVIQQLSLVTGWRGPMLAAFEQDEADSDN